MLRRYKILDLLCWPVWKKLGNSLLREMSLKMIISISHGYRHSGLIRYTADIRYIQYNKNSLKNVIFYASIYLGYFRNNIKRLLVYEPNARDRYFIVS